MNALTLRMQDEMFAIEAGSVREILDLVPITEVPNAPAGMMGGHPGGGMPRPMPPVGAASGAPGLPRPVIAPPPAPKHP